MSAPAASHEPDFGRDLTLVGTSRCDVPAREAAGGISAPLSAARTAQRAVPTRIRVQSAKISWNSSHEPASGSPALQRVAQFRFMGREQVRKEHGAFHEPGGARLRRALTDSCGWEIRARRSLAPPFMVQMRGCKTVETIHEPSLRPRPHSRPRPRLADPFFEDEDDPVHGPNACGKTKGGFP